MKECKIPTLQIWAGVAQPAQIQTVWVERNMDFAHQHLVEKNNRKMKHKKHKACRVLFSEVSPNDRNFYL